MAEHVSVFYIGDKYDTYILCTDDELEQLKDIEWWEAREAVGNQAAILAIPPLSVLVGTNGKVYMHVLYNPVDTEFMRQPNGCVERVVVLSDSWIADKADKFYTAFPKGLSLDLLCLYKPIEELV